MDRLRRTANSFTVAALGALFNVLNAAAYPRWGRRGYTVRIGMACGDGLAPKLDVYAPKDASPHAPVIVFFYGGSWEGGSRRAYRFVGKALAAAGVTAVIPDYRRYPETAFPGFVEDGARAVAWAWRNLAEGKGPLFVAGHSAGAHIAALIGLDERYLAAEGVDKNILAGTIALSGPYDFLPFKEARYEAIFPEAVRARSQPINFVDGTEPPMLLVAGYADRTVSPGNTTRLAARIRERGGSVSVKLYPGVGHAGTVTALVPFLPLRQPPVLEDILSFIRAIGDSRTPI